jgi:hypothetical protein
MPRTSVGKHERDVGVLGHVPVARGWLGGVEAQIGGSRQQRGESGCHQLGRPVQVQRDDSPRAGAGRVQTPAEGRGRVRELFIADYPVTVDDRGLGRLRGRHAQDLD